MFGYRSRDRAGRGALAVFVVVAVVAAVISPHAIAAPAAGAVAKASASSAVCSRTGATAAVVKRIFGAGATASNYTAYPPPRCEIQAGKGSSAPTECSVPSATCTTTDVFLDPKSAFAHDVASQVASMKMYGRVTRVPVKSAGSDAVLLLANHYGGVTNPVLLFTSGAYTVQIIGSFAGVPYTSSVYKQWRVLAHVIHVHLG